MRRRAREAAEAKRRLEKRQAMREDHADRLEWIAEVDVDPARDSSYVYQELHCVFNDVQLLANMQDEVHPCKIGYDFQYGTGGAAPPRRGLLDTIRSASRGQQFQHKHADGSRSTEPCPCLHQRH